MNNFLGIKIVESPLCEMRVPVRKHKRRRHQSAAYHARIQKKWTKRFGMKLERVAFMFQHPVSGVHTMALDPRDIVAIRNFIPGAPT